jgi:hypothetical protein
LQKSPLYISIVSQIVVPLGICCVIRQTGKLDPIDIWLAILFGQRYAVRAERAAVQPGAVARDPSGRRPFAEDGFMIGTHP